jgi:hypothetical protein
MALVLLVLAIVCFAFRAAGTQLGRLDIGWLGMCFFAASFLVPGLSRLF